MTDSPRDPTALPAVIETERLALRPWETDDAPALFEALAESMDYLHPWVPWAAPGPVPSDRARELLLSWMRDFRGGHNHLFAAFEQSDARLVGGIGLYPRVGPEALEIGYWIRQSRARRGFATEAGRALTHVAFALPGITRVEMHVDVANHASARIPPKLGYRPMRVRQSDGQDPREIAVFALHRDELGSAGRQPKIRWAEPRSPGS